MIPLGCIASCDIVLFLLATSCTSASGITLTPFPGSVAILHLCFVSRMPGVASDRWLRGWARIPNGGRMSVWLHTCAGAPVRASVEVFAGSGRALAPWTDHCTTMVLSHPPEGVSAQLILLAIGNAARRARLSCGAPCVRGPMDRATSDDALMTAAARPDAVAPPLSRDNSTTDIPGRAKDAPPMCESTTLEATRTFLADVVADAARDAVAAAFAEFRPMLLQAVASVATGPPIDRSTGPGHHSPRSFDAISISQDLPVLALQGQLSEEPQGWGMSVTETIGSERSKFRAERTKSRTYSQGRPTIESLQADLAMAVLDRSGYGPSMRRSNLPPQQHHRRRNVAGLKSQSAESAPSEEAARVVFETPLVLDPGPWIPGASADADGIPCPMLWLAGRS